MTEICYNLPFLALAIIYTFECSQMAGFGYAATNGLQWPPLPSKAAGMYSVTALLLFFIAKGRGSLQTDIKRLALLKRCSPSSPAISLQQYR